MDDVPAEIVLLIVSYLDDTDIITCQLVSHRFRTLCRDSDIWKERCFCKSPAERLRKRRHNAPHLSTQVAALRDAILNRHATSDDSSPEIDGSLERARSRARWDPTDASESIDFYQEYIHRHAPIAAPVWLDLGKRDTSRDALGLAATGVGTLYDQQGSCEAIYVPLEDGSISAWQSRCSNGTHELRPTARSGAGLLTDLADSSFARSQTAMTESGSIECVSMDASRRRGYFAVQNEVKEVDLETLQLISSQVYPFQVSVLSEITQSSCLFVGTTNTVHLYDAAHPSRKMADLSASCELLNEEAACIRLTQPGPLSILSNDTSIWIAGRFTHLLNYDTRFFGRLLSTVHSGARISSLTSLSFPHRTNEIDITSGLRTAHNLGPGLSQTLVAAGVYKGKGSLELYGLSSSPTGTSTPQSNAVTQYQNRQTASTSKLLSVIPHNASLATADSDGNIRWFERNARHTIRTYNINSTNNTTTSAYNPTSTATNAAQPPNALEALAQQQLSHHQTWRPPNAADLPGEGDIVQKLAPLMTGAAARDATQNPLLLWTGDGRVGVLGFGHTAPVKCGRSSISAVDADGDADGEAYVDQRGLIGQDASADADERLRSAARRAERRAREDAERQYAGVLRRALEEQANEARFMRGLGLG